MNPSVVAVKGVGPFTPEEVRLYYTTHLYYTVLYYHIICLIKYVFPYDGIISNIIIMLPGMVTGSTPLTLH